MTDPDWLKRAAEMGPGDVVADAVHPARLVAAFEQTPLLIGMLRLLAEANRALLETWKHAGPHGSGQMEKFDHAIRLARIAADAYRTGELPKGD